MSVSRTKIGSDLCASASSDEWCRGCRVNLVRYQDRSFVKIPSSNMYDLYEKRSRSQEALFRNVQRGLSSKDRKQQKQSNYSREGRMLIVADQSLEESLDKNTKGQER